MLEELLLEVREERQAREAQAADDRAIQDALRGDDQGFAVNRAEGQDVSGGRGFEGPVPKRPRSTGTEQEGQSVSPIAQVLSVQSVDGGTHVVLRVVRGPSVDKRVQADVD